MYVPLVLGSDKTIVSVATGHQEYHPLYMSLGNLHNTARCAHKEGLVLVGLFVIPKGICSIFVYLQHLTYSILLAGRLDDESTECYDFSFLYDYDITYDSYRTFGLMTPLCLPLVSVTS